MQDKVYLKPNVVVEPLFNQWYAWSHLIAPSTAAMNIANSHLKIMKSYVAAPQVHAQAVKNPAMLGGPFIDYEGRRVNEIKALIERTTKNQAHMLKFAESVKALDERLRNEANGYSLEPLYEKVPDDLKGYVELVYDLNNNPSIRFIEGLLYRSEYYDPSLQSLSLSLMHHDDRAFALSTPRLPDERALHLSVPFSHEGVDELFRMKHVAQPFGYISQLLGLDAGQAAARVAQIHGRSNPRPLLRARLSLHRDQRRLHPDRPGAQLLLRERHKALHLPGSPRSD
jgi:hypothetical protein